MTSIIVGRMPSFACGPIVRNVSGNRKYAEGGLAALKRPPAAPSGERAAASSRFRGHIVAVRKRLSSWASARLTRLTRLARSAVKRKTVRCSAVSRRGQIVGSGRGIRVWRSPEQPGRLGLGRSRKCDKAAAGRRQRNRVRSRFTYFCTQNAIPFVCSGTLIVGQNWIPMAQTTARRRGRRHAAQTGSSNCPTRPTATQACTAVQPDQCGVR